MFKGQPGYIYILTLIQLNQYSGCNVYCAGYTGYAPCITLHDHLASFYDSNNTKVMEFDSIHMYSHILVGAGQSLLYQCTQCVYVCAHVNMLCEYAQT